MPWKASTLLLAVGTILTAISTQLILFPETQRVGIILGAAGVGCIAASQYLSEQGYKAALKHR